MKPTSFTKAVDEVVAITEQAIDIVIEELVDPLTDLGNPEKLIGKDYSVWTPQDLAMLTQIYGTGKNTPLSNLIFNREYANLKELEAEEA